ncbi:MAG: type II CAAX prenyl endopeptidase Rce1 family protein [Fimbriimonadales bacterium]
MAVTTVLFVVCYDILKRRQFKMAFIVGTTLAWLGYILCCIWRAPDTRRAYGLSSHDLRQSALLASGVFVVGATFCLVVAFTHQRLHLYPHMLLSALLYPAWGLVQQTLVQAMVVRNLSGSLATPWVVVIAGLLFGAVHWPDLALAAATAILGAVFTVIFLHWPSVWALGLCHGWLGVLFYFWVLKRDPWEKTMPGAHS